MAKKQNENALTNLLFNIIVPAVILMKFSKEQYLGSTWGLIIALAFPAIYFLYDLFKNKNTNFISILGFVSVLLTGGIGLLALSPKIYAIKEALIPFIIGVAVLASVRTKYAVFNKLLYRPEVFEVTKIDQILNDNGNKETFIKKMTYANFFLSSSFFLSSFLNYGLARLIVKSPSGEAFNEEVGRMTMLSYPVIVVPSMIILGLVFYFFIRDIKRLTGLTFEEVLAIKDTK